MVLSCTVTEIRRLIGWKLCIFPTPLLFGALAKFPLEFRAEVNREEAWVMGLPGGESCMILTSTVFDWSTRVTVTDGRTDGRAIAYARYSIYAVARKKMIHSVLLITVSVVDVSPNLITPSLLKPFIIISGVVVSQHALRLAVHILNIVFDLIWS